MEHAIRVSQLNQYLKTLLEGQSVLKRLTVRGEISNFTNHYSSGHFYFTLKDERSSIRVVMFHSYAVKVRFRPENGMQVLVTGSVRLYDRDGTAQIYAEQLQPDGIGSLALAFEQEKQKLAALGWFDISRKKPIPAMPQRIGVVTAKTGAALQDILNILSRRYPIGEVVLFNALVQGPKAADSLVSAIETASRCRLDVLIVGRGGGSMEDLWCFNEEIVAKAILDCPIPVISAVGHEVDYTITDFVADLRAPTPSAAAELCAPDVADLKEKLDSAAIALDQLMDGLLTSCDRLLQDLQKRLLRSSPEQQLKLREERLIQQERRLFLASPERKIREQEQHISEDRQRMEELLAGKFETAEQKLTRQGVLLEALNPLKVLTRGYSVTKADGKIINGKKMLSPGTVLETRLAYATVESQVTGWKEEPES